MNHEQYTTQYTILRSLPPMLARLLFCRGPYNLRIITYEFIKELCKTNPILSAVGGLQTNLTDFITKDYKNFIPLAVYIKTNPNQTQFKPNLRKAKMDVNSFITKDYRKNDDFSVRINKPNFVKGPK